MVISFSIIYGIIDSFVFVIIEFVCAIAQNPPKEVKAIIEIYCKEKTLVLWIMKGIPLVISKIDNADANGS